MQRQLIKCWWLNEPMPPTQEVRGDFSHINRTQLKQCVSGKYWAINVTQPDTECMLLRSKYRAANANYINISVWKWYLVLIKVEQIRQTGSWWVRYYFKTVLILWDTGSFQSVTTHQHCVVVDLIWTRSLILGNFNVSKVFIFTWIQPLKHFYNSETVLPAVEVDV